MKPFKILALAVFLIPPVSLLILPFKNSLPVRDRLILLREKSTIHPILWNIAEKLDLPREDKLGCSMANPLCADMPTYFIGDCAVWDFNSPKLMLLGAHVETFARWVNSIPCDNPTKVTARFIVMMGGMEAMQRKPPEYIRSRIDRTVVPKLKKRFPNAVITVVSPADIMQVAKKFPRSDMIEAFEKTGYRDCWHFSKQGATALCSRYKMLTSL
jgi:hypothetical protein